MFLTVIKNLFSRPVTRRYPYADIRPPVKGYRGTVLWDENKCKVCGACARVCPAKAIEVLKPARQIKYYPFNCIYCSACVDVCPVKAITQTTQYTAPSNTKESVIYDIPVPPVPPVPPAAPPAA